MKKRQSAVFFNIKFYWSSPFLDLEQVILFDTGGSVMQGITGSMVYYYYVCKRKLWYFSHQLNMESNSELVGIGKLVDEDSYSREKKHIMIDDTINIDFLQSWKIVHEVKKSKSIEPAAIWQLKYYMMVLEEKGMKIEKGILDFPLLRRRESFYLTEEDKKELNQTLLQIQIILSSSHPPLLEKMKICKKCAYYEFCYI